MVQSMQAHSAMISIERGRGVQWTKELEIILSKPRQVLSIFRMRLLDRCRALEIGLIRSRLVTMRLRYLKRRRVLAAPGLGANHPRGLSEELGILSRVSFVQFALDAATGSVRHFSEWLGLMLRTAQF